MIGFSSAVLLTSIAATQAYGTVSFNGKDAKGLATIVGAKNDVYTLDDDQRKTFGRVVTLPVVITPKKPASPGGAKGVEKIDFETIDSWNKQKPRLTDPKFAELAAQMKLFQELSEKWARQQASDQELLSGTAEVRETLGLAALKARNSPDQLKALMIHYESVVKSEKAMKKAVYGRSDVYPPATYEEIFKQSHAVVGLARKSTSEVFCSGVLVARDRLLTARHCFDDYPATDVQVWLGFDSTGVHDAYDVDSVVKGEAEPSGPEPLDYALVAVKKNAGGKLPGDGYQPACLSTSRLKRDDAVYLVGHPTGSPTMVHDNAFVLFPFQATESEYGQLLLAVKNELKGLGETGGPLKADLQIFVDSYVLRPGASSQDPQLYENFSKRYDQLPTIGVDSDTSHGNSGSPMYGRREHKVVGLLFAGEDDLSVSYVPGWKAHEAVLPITSVVSQLDQKHAGWRKGVCF